jgi:hypothetical protein
VKHFQQRALINILLFCEPLNDIAVFYFANSNNVATLHKTDPEVVSNMPSFLITEYHPVNGTVKIITLTSNYLS